MTVLHTAALYDQFSMAKFLLNNGAKFNARCSEGGTALELVMRIHNQEMVFCLIEWVVNHFEDWNLRRVCRLFLRDLE